jgi:replicative DNA helicase
MTDLVPHDLDAERSVLGSVLIRERISDVLGVVDGPDFFLPAHEAIYGAMLDLSSQRKPLDILTVASVLRTNGTLAKLEGGELYLAQLSRETPTASNARYYAEIVREKAAGRRLIEQCRKAEARAAGAPIGDVVADLRVALTGLRAESGGPVGMGEAVPGYLDALEARSLGKATRRVASGLRGLDSKLLGGVAPGQLIVVGGNPGSGKTSLAFQWGLEAALAGVNTLIFSLEMKRVELMDRGVSYLSGVDGSRLVNGDKHDLDMWHKVTPAAKRLGTLPLAIDDRKLSCDQIVSEALRWRDRQEPGSLALIVVDYLGIIRSTGKVESRQQEVGGWSREMKILAGDVDAPLVLCAQLNRQNMAGGEKRKPVLSDLRDSGEVEQNADVVLFPVRDFTDGAEIGVAKHRGGPVGVVDGLVFDGPTTSFRTVGGGNVPASYVD